MADHIIACALGEEPPTTMFQMANKDSQAGYNMKYFDELVIMRSQI